MIYKHSVHKALTCYCSQLDETVECAWLNSEAFSFGKQIWIGLVQKYTESVTLRKLDFRALYCFCTCCWMLLYTSNKSFSLPHSSPFMCFFWKQSLVPVTQFHIFKSHPSNLCCGTHSELGTAFTFSTKPWSNLLTKKVINLTFFSFLF